MNVQITVIDVNDNSPRFDQDSYTITVPEFLAIGQSAIQVCKLILACYNIEGNCVSRLQQSTQMPWVQTLKFVMKSWAPTPSPLIPIQVYIHAIALQQYKL